MAKDKDSTGRKSSVKQPVDLSWIETWIYVVIWVGSCFYSIYTVLIYSLDHGQILNKGTFEDGWSLIGRKRDKSDFEWQFWREMVPKKWPIYVGHIILGQMCRFWNQEKRHTILMFYGLVAVGYCITFKVVIYQVSVCLLIAGIAYVSRSIIVVWIASLGHLYTLQAIYKYPKGFISKQSYWLCDDDEAYVLHTIFSTSYVFMKYISFSHDLINHLQAKANAENEITNCSETNGNALNRQPSSHSTSSKNLTEKETVSMKKYSVVEFLSYVFYFPLFLTGPIYTFDRFYKEIHAPIKPWTRDRVVPLVKDILRVTFWTLFMDAWLHYFYFYSIQHHHSIMREIPYWTLAGIGYQVGQFFMVKYVSLFGVPACIAKLDGLTPPYTPRCGGWIYKYSDMWRNFDRGLHGFMTRHIYFPLGGSRYGVMRQLFATMICYIFVFVWHGFTLPLFVWAGLNFVDIAIETIAKLFSLWPTFIKFEAKYVSPRWGRRLRALFWTPVLMMNFLSSFTFFAGGTVGKIYAYRFLIEGFPVTYLAVGLGFYSFIQTSMEYSNYLERKKLKQD